MRRSKHLSRNLGWAGVVAVGVWLYYDYAAQLRKAILAGWASVVLIAAHIATARAK